MVRLVCRPLRHYLLRLSQLLYNSTVWSVSRKCHKLSCVCIIVLDQNNQRQYILLKELYRITYIYIYIYNYTYIKIIIRTTRENGCFRKLLLLSNRFFGGMKSVIKGLFCPFSRLPPKRVKIKVQK